ncbi:hypothetical protein [Ignatzschineria sp. LJL83]
MNKDKSIVNGYFAISKELFDLACKLGFNEAISYLVISCGTAGTGMFSSWSATAVYTYTGIRWKKADKAISTLIENGIITDVSKNPDKPRSKPRYQIHTKETEDKSLIWLPNSLFERFCYRNSKEEFPNVIERIIEYREVELLRFVILLYKHQNLLEHGGINPSVIYARYGKEFIKKMGSWNFYLFESDGKKRFDSYSDNPIVVEMGLTDLIGCEEAPDDGHEFWRYFILAEEIGVIERAVYLFEDDSDDAGILFPIDGVLPHETQIKEVSKEYLLTRNYPDDNYDGDMVLGEGMMEVLEQGGICIPLPVRMENPVAKGIYRLKHRANTQLTGEWLKDMKSKVRRKVSMIEGKI